MQNYPSFNTGNFQNVATTGFSNWIRATGGTCTAVRISATKVSAGDSISANTDMVYFRISTSTPASGDKASSQQIAPGENVELPLSDTGNLWFCGAASNSVRIAAFR